jgi:CRISPR/Cas system-associated protein Csm6
VIIGAPPATTDELRLRQLDEAIREVRREDREEAERRAIEDQRRAEFDAGRGRMAMLEQEYAELLARLIEQKTHLRASAEQELLRGRAERLDGDISAQRDRLAALETERALIGAELSD